MRRAIAVTLLAAVSGGAAAEWVRSGRTETFTAYVDPTTIRKAGSAVKLWQLYDFNEIQPSSGEKPYMSTRSQYEYDCDKKRTRQLKVRSYSRNMGKGKQLASVSSPSAWTPVPGESILETIWETACGKR